MKMKYIKTIAKLLVKIGYADYYISTTQGDNKIIGYAVCWGDADGDEWYDDERHYISLFDKDQPTLEGIMQAHALEDHFAWNEKDLWKESRNYTHRLVSVGQYSIYERRLDKIKHCIKEITD